MEVYRLRNKQTGKFFCSWVAAWNPVHAGNLPRVMVVETEESVCGMHKRGIQKGTFNAEELAATGDFFVKAANLITKLGETNE